MSWRVAHYFGAWAVTNGRQMITGLTHGFARSVADDLNRGDLRTTLRHSITFGLTLVMP